MPLTDLDLCDLCQRLYDEPNAKAWDMFWGEDEWGLCAALHIAGDRDVIIHRGSETVLDWYDDAKSELPHIPPDATLGEVPAGFYKPLPLWHASTYRAIRPGPVIIGHSLGAARAVEHGALLAAIGKPPIAVIAWGCPRAGTQRLNDIYGGSGYAGSGTAVRWYRNATDPVPEVPFSVPLVLPWIHCGAETKLNEPAPSDDQWGILRDHHLFLYRAGVAKLSPMPGVDLTF
jgi:hypothetical protein